MTAYQMFLSIALLISFYIFFRNEYVYSYLTESISNNDFNFKRTTYTKMMLKFWDWKNYDRRTI
jgi:hypothetical protein